jgi:hypothetical protein
MRNKEKNKTGQAGQGRKNRGKEQEERKRFL